MTTDMRIKELCHFDEYKTFTIPTLDNVHVFYYPDKNYFYISKMDSMEYIDYINMNIIKYNNIKNVNDVYEYIYNFIKEYINIKDNKENFTYKIIEDKYRLFNEIKEKTKYELDKDILKNILLSYPNNNKQIIKMLIEEVKRFNKNFLNNHYIMFKDNNPYHLIIRLKYNNKIIEEKLKNNNCEYIEFYLNVDSEMYPLLPPKLTYHKPFFNDNLSKNLENLDILKTTKWNRNITLEWLILQIAEKFEIYFETFDINNNITFSDLDIEINNLYNIMDISNYDKFEINIDYVNLSKDYKSNNKYWASGTGYGYGHKEDKWDINEYLKKQNIHNKNIINTINKIINLYDFNKNNNLDNLQKIINIQFNGINLLDIDNNFELYQKYIELIKITKINIDEIIKENIYIEVDNIMSNDNLSEQLESNKKELYNNILELFKPLKIGQCNYTATDDIIDSYTNLIKANLYDEYIFDTTHLYYKETINKVINKKSLMRIVSELYSLKKNLPINWDSSSIMRIDKKQFNCIKFIITGPKDTPYHNGIYEFHAYFPDTYPNVPPKVLLNTTDSGKVRFNPNLYHCGKVCLSLLGTWGGDKAESWNPELSTFLQVIVSIQSLIMVEQPYFNEPGWEQFMNTDKGQKCSFEYTDHIRYQNLRVCIVNQIKNPPTSFEEFTINHFKLKKDEINNIVNKWINESKSYKNQMTDLLNEFNNLV